MFSKLKGWKTVLFNGARALIDSGILVFLLTIDWEVAGFSPQAALWILVVLSLFDKLFNIYLRSITDSPMGRKY